MSDQRRHTGIVRPRRMPTRAALVGCGRRPPRPLPTLPGNGRRPAHRQRHSPKGFTSGYPVTLGRLDRPQRRTYVGITPYEQGGRLITDVRIRPITHTIGVVRATHEIRVTPHICASVQTRRGIMTTAADRLTRAWITMASQGQRESTRPAAAPGTAVESAYCAPAVCWGPPPIAAAYSSLRR
jgi:hypothetical protein